MTTASSICSLSEIQRPPGGSFRGGSQKCVENLANVSSVTSVTSYVTCLNTIAEGPALWQRVGRKICMDSVDLAITLSANGNTPAVVSPNAYRVTLLYDRQPNGSFPLSSQIFAGYTDTGSFIGSSGTFVGINPDNFNRFLIIYDRTFYPQSNGNGTTVTGQQFSSTSNEVFFDRFSLDLGGLVTKYAGPDIFYNNIATGSLLLYFQNQEINPPGFSIIYSSRLCYSDH